MKKLLSILLAACMLLSMAAFAEEAEVSTPLVVAISTLSEKFSPFYADTGYDVSVTGLTQISMLTTDRVGGIIYNGIEGETVNYNGTDYTYTGACDLAVDYDEGADLTTYTAKLREDIKFSDGEPVTADDIIFTYYVLLDPAYVGSNTLNSYDIVGLKAYKNQIPEETLAVFDPIVADVKKAGFGYTAAEDDSFTQEQYDVYYNALTEIWKGDVQGIIDYVFANYLAYAPDYFGFSEEEVTENDDLKIAFGMVMWGFGKTEAGVLTDSEGNTYDLANGVYPTLDDYFNCTFKKYAGDIDAYLGTESATGTTSESAVSLLYTKLAEDKEVDLSEDVPNISGIKKLDDYTVEVKVNGFSAPAVYSIFGAEITPMHYYGDPAQYDYENNMFGHPYGDLSVVQSKTSTPMGAGPYKFVKYENRVVYYEANENYYKGAPLIKEFQYKETNAAEVASAVQTGTADGGEMSGTKANFEMLAGFNSNGELTGDVITTYSVANLGYGYIGINAGTVNVAGDPGSDASKDLRKALATVLAVYRDTAFDSYYGDAAAVINYPISSTSWASPQPADEGYRVAFSVDVEGNPIYTADMTADEKYAAALEAAKGFFIAAGYTFDEATGLFTAAPEGAKLSYEAIIPGDGIGDHPSFAVLTDARNALATIGIELKINDPSDNNVLWDALDAGTQELWCAAWGSTIDPDMYQVYHSSNIVGLGGSDSNHYHIRSEALDTLILDARKSSDQAFRKQLYKAALDELIDWAVEVPAYQRQNIVIASTQRVDISTVTPDVTTYWGWLSEVETMQMTK
ncbi:MAG: ABC transporter substrate-binding protein [Christensenellales bacterium]|jgi:peptide/nickel transport system substrate-binding protein